MGEERPAFKTEIRKAREAAKKHAGRFVISAAHFFTTVSRHARAALRSGRASLRRTQSGQPPAWIGYAAGGLGLSLLAAVVLAYIVLKLAEPPLALNSDLYALNRPANYTFLDRNGAPAGTRGAITGERLKLSEMPSYLPAAFLAMEDRKFYRHHGVDPAGLLRAFWTDIKAGRVVQGGSTITQQTVKIVFLTPDRTFARKIREISGALALEHHLSKTQILTLYLNRIYLGAGAYGVDGAAHVYFGKSARHVTLAEAAMLAALTTSPSTFSPRRDLPGAQTRASKVLDALVASGALAAKDVAYARAHPATIVDQSTHVARNYFLDAATEEAKTLLPGITGDLTIATTLDSRLQDAASTSLSAVLDRRGAKLHATQGALVAMTPDGAVRAIVGGRDYADSSFDRVTQAHRQPGSAFKPFVYLTALERGLTPNTVRIDAPIAIADYAPDNYTDTHVGPVTLTDALARSINTVAVQLGQEVGMKAVIATARRLGITSPLAPNASLPLGTSEVTPLELTAAYAAFASAGQRADPYIVNEIRGPSGTVLYRRNAPPPPIVIGDDDVRALNGMLYHVVQDGTGRAAAVPRHEVAGKTGTSADFHDAWFVGFSADLVTGVWVGNDDSTPMKKVTGGSLPAQIWSGFMRVALKNSHPIPLPRSEPPPPDAQDDEPDVVSQGLDAFGNFFGRLFGMDDAPPRQAARPPDESAAPPQ